MNEMLWVSKCGTSIIILTYPSDSYAYPTHADIGTITMKIPSGKGYDFLVWLANNYKVIGQL